MALPVDRSAPGSSEAAQDCDGLESVPDGGREVQGVGASAIHGACREGPVLEPLRAAVVPGHRSGSRAYREVHFIKGPLQRPRNDELDGPIWINVWTNVNHRGHPRGINFCLVTPPHLAPDWETGEEQNLVTKDDGMQCQALAPPPWQYWEAAPAKVGVEP